MVSVAVYYNSLSNGFVFDDWVVIVKNKHIADLKNSLPSFFSNSYFKIAGGEASYRPLTTLSYFLIHAFAGLNPFYYHLGSILLHAINVMLVYPFNLIAAGGLVQSAAGGPLICLPSGPDRSGGRHRLQ